MNLTEKTLPFTNLVIQNILEIPNLENEVNPLLTAELREKMITAKKKLEEIINSFNVLPGVWAELYTNDASPDGLLEIDVPATHLFLTDMDAYKKNRKSEVATIIVGFHASEVVYSDEGDTSNPRSQVYTEWLKKTFSGYNKDKKMTISEVFATVQDLLNSYMKVLD